MSRRAARAAAVEILYAADLRQVGSDEVLAERETERAAAAYTAELVREVEARRAEIDELLGRTAIGWTPERMSQIDRNVLRVALAELLAGRVPPAVAIDEAVRLAKRYSGEDAGRFVNGVLSAVLRARQSPEG